MNEQEPESERPDAPVVSLDDRRAMLLGLGVTNLRALQPKPYDWATDLEVADAPIEPDSPDDPAHKSP